MKKIYPLLCAALLLLATSCKKDEPANEPQPQKEADPITLVGKWKMTAQLYTSYLDDKIEAEDVDVLSEGTTTLEFKANGTASITYENTSDDYITFNYEANDAKSYTMWNYKEFVDGKLTFSDPQRTTQPIEKLTTTTLQIHEASTVDVEMDNVTHKRREIFKTTYTRVK